MKKPSGNDTLEKTPAANDPPDLDRALKDCKFTIRYMGVGSERVINICRTTLHFYSVLRDCLERLEQQERKIDGLVASREAPSGERSPDVYRQARSPRGRVAGTNRRAPK